MESMTRIEVPREEVGERYPLYRICEIDASDSLYDLIKHGFTRTDTIKVGKFRGKVVAWQEDRKGVVLGDKDNAHFTLVSSMGTARQKIIDKTFSIAGMRNLKSPDNR